MPYQFSITLKVEGHKHDLGKKKLTILIMSSFKKKFIKNVFSKISIKQKRLQRHSGLAFLEIR